MKVYAIIALVLCAAAAASALETRGPLQTAACATAIEQLTQLADKTQNQLLKDKINQALGQLQELCHSRGIFDSLANVLNLGSVWNIISGLQTSASALFGQFTDILEQIVFSGKFLWDSHIKDLLAQLVSELKDHAMNAAPIVASYIPKLLAVLSQAGKREIPLALERGIWDTVSDVFGLGNIWSNITSVAADAKQTLITLLAQLMLMGTQAFNQAKVILAQLASDLVGHTSNAAPLVQDAIQKLKDLIAATAISSVGKRSLADTRGFWDTISNVFGLNTVWSTITSVSGSIKDKFMLTLEKLLFAGSQAWANAIPIFKQLVADLTAHAGNAAPLLAAAVDQLTALLPTGRRSLVAEERGILEFAENLFGISGIINTVTSLGSSIKDNFLNVVKQIFFAGTQAWANAKPIFQQLVSDLTSHAGNAKPLVTEAIANLQAVLAGAMGKREVVLERGFVDYLEKFFGLGAIIENITALGGDLKAKFFAILEKVFFAGSQAWANAMPIFKELIANLKGHAELAVPLFTQAISQLTNVVGVLGKRELAVERGFLDFVENMFGISGIISTVTSLGSSIKDKFLDVVKQVFFAGTQAWAAATPIFQQLVSDLTSHAGNALPLVNGAIATLKDMLVQIAAQHVGKRGLFDSLISQFQTAASQVSTILGAVHGQLKEKLAVVLMQVATLAGQAKENAMKVISQLVADLKAHAENAVPLVQAAIAQLMALLPIGQSRGLSNTLDAVISAFNNFFPNIEFGNLGNEVAALVGHVTGPLKDQLLAVLAQVFFAVKDKKDKAIQLLVETFNKLKDNWQSAPSVISGLVSQLIALLN